MRRALPFAGGATAAVAAALAVTAVTGAGDACAQSGDAVAPRIACPGATTPPAPTTPGGNRTVTTPGTVTGTGPCTTTTVLRTVSVRPAGRGLRVAYRRRGSGPVRVDVFQSATTRTVLGERLVFRATARRSPVRWSGGRQGRRTAPRPGVFFVRVSARQGGATDVRRFALRRAGRGFRTQPTFARRDGCGAIRAFKLERPAFGGRANRAVSVSFRVANPGRVTVDLLRGGRRVRTLSSTTRRAGVLHRVRLDAEGLRRGRYQVRLRTGSATATLTAARI